MADIPIKIAAFGDSLSAAYALKTREGFAPVLQNTLSRMGIRAEIFCAAVSGDTSADGLARADEMLRQNPDIVIVQFGYNDLYYGAPLASLKQNLTAILARIKQSGARTLLAGIHAPPGTPANEEKNLAAMYESLRDECDAPLYPFFLDGVVSDPSLLLPGDDVHPNAAGVRAVAENIAPYLAKIANDLGERAPALPR